MVYLQKNILATLITVQDYEIIQKLVLLPTISLRVLLPLCFDTIINC